MKRGLRFTVSISSTSFWNSNLSSMVATGNSPPYGVRFLPSKSNGVEPAILLGSGVTAGGPCLERVLPLCFFSFFTFWVTSWKSAREARTSLPLCFTTGFPGSPEGSLPQSLFSSSNAVHRSGVNVPRRLQIVDEVCLGIAADAQQRARTGQPEISRKSRVKRLVIDARRGYRILREGAVRFCDLTQFFLLRGQFRLDLRPGFLLLGGDRRLEICHLRERLAAAA